MTLRLATAISARLEARFAAELSECEGVRLVRRCADITELLTAVQTAAVDVVGVSADFPGLSGSVLAEISLGGVRVIAVSAPSSLVDARQFEGWGISQTYLVGSGSLNDVIFALESGGLTGTQDRAQTRRTPGSGGWEPGASQASGSLVDHAGEADGFSHDSSGDGDDSADTGARFAHVVTVTGAAGAPGRTTTAVNLAQVLARSGPTLLIDADTHAPSVAGHLGLLDEAPGILAAARLADAGTLSAAQLQQLVATASSGLTVLTGIGSANRWPELGRHHLERIFDIASSQYEWIVVDTSGVIDTASAMLLDAAAPTRHLATLVALERAEHVTTVLGCDPISLQRFVAGWQDLCDFSAVTPLVVVNRARRSGVGGKPSTVVEGALRRFAGIDVDVYLPDVPAAIDAAMLAGRCLVETGADLGYERAVCELANLLGATVGRASPGGNVGRPRWRRSGAR